MTELYKSPTDFLLCEINNKVLTITLNRPEAMNALRPEMFDGIKMLVTQAEKDSDVSVIVEGHCDERGTREYNLALGEKRAQSVKNYLISLGISSNRISTISYGKERPAVVGSNDGAWAQNRRSVTVVN